MGWSPTGVLVTVLAIVALVNSAPLLLGGGGAPPVPTGRLTPESVGSASVAPVANPNPFSTGMAASVALGELNLSSFVTATPPNASTFLGEPEWAKLDAHGNLWVADFGGNRVLEFAPPFSTGEAATLVVGQATFSGDSSGNGAANLSNPASVAFDALGDLWVSNFGNGRIYEYAPPFATGMAASLVLGAPSFSSPVNVTPTSAQVSGPADLTFDAQGRLWVADADANRVLAFDPPFHSGMAASVVLGQPNFVSSAPGLSSTGLSYPLSVDATPTELWVADSANNRVLGYPVPVTSDEGATVVLGQSTFTQSNATGPGALVNPTAVASGPAEQLWVSDTGDNRVVEYPADPATFSLPLVALGQSTLSGDQPGLSARNLTGPIGVALSGGAIWVTDSASNRVLEYVPTTFPVSVSEVGLPTGTTWQWSFDNVSHNGMAPTPGTVSAVNGSYPFSVTPVAGYAADPAYETQVVDGQPVGITVTFAATGPDPFSDGMPATVVLGQSDFWNDSVATGIVSYAVQFDSRGDLWAVDWSNNRVLEFQPPFTVSETPSLVLGQSSFSGRAPGTGPANLSNPDGLAFDGAGNLWVAEYGNNRVVEFPPPFVSGEVAALVLGQSGFNQSGAGDGPTGLTGPSGLAYEGSTLWVCDHRNNRVVGFPAPFSTGEAATQVLGQPDLNGTGANVSAQGLSLPSWIAFDARGDAWVADSGNDRVLEFAAPLGTDKGASLVLGQPNFTAYLPGLGNTLFSPNGVAVDPQGNVWVADSANNRVLEFLGPTFTDNQTPARVVGQGNLSTRTAALGPRGLSYPSLPAFDPEGDLWVADLGNDRILGYLPATYTVTFQAQGAETPAAWNLTFDGIVTHLTGPSVSVATPNATLPWSVSAPGWTLPAYQGHVEINGAPEVVPLDFVRDVYSLTFTESGLPTGTVWSVTVGGSTQTANRSTITFLEPNGTFAYSIGNVSGYTVSPPPGTVAVRGAATSVTVTYASTSSAGGAGPSPLVWALVGVAVVVVALIALGVRRRGRRPPASPTSGPPPRAVGPAPAGPAPTEEPLPDPPGS